MRGCRDRAEWDSKTAGDWWPRVHCGEITAITPESAGIGYYKTSEVVFSPFPFSNRQIGLLGN
jgi:hypothetical protein